MNFTTRIPISKASHFIDYNSKIVSFGSCFAESMGQKFEYFKFQNSVNPFGIIFNPISIENIFSRVVNQDNFTEDDVFFHNERWHCFEAHSDVSDSNKVNLIHRLNQIISHSHQQITEATHIIITYGTSWVYRNIESNQIVANCHKVPQKQFTKELLSAETIQNSIKNTVELIQKINPSCHFIFTISPVRHIKDGFVENQRSKAHLIGAIHNSQFTIHNYFPSYEIMMDELRDYRFYAEDMLHPNQVAINYIWERFIETYIDENSFLIMNQVDNIQKRLLHKPFDTNSESYQQFLLSLQEKIKVLQKQQPHIKF